MGNLRDYSPSFMPCGMYVFDIEGIIPLVSSLVRRASSGHLMLFPWICAFLEKYQMVIWCFFFYFFLQGESVGCLLDIFLHASTLAKRTSSGHPTLLLCSEWQPNTFFVFFPRGKKAKVFWVLPKEYWVTTKYFSFKFMHCEISKALGGHA